MQNPPAWLYVAIGIACLVLFLLGADLDPDLNRQTADAALRQYLSHPSRANITDTLDLDQRGKFTLHLKDRNSTAPPIPKEQINHLAEVILNAIQDPSSSFEKLENNVTAILPIQYTLYPNGGTSVFSYMHKVFGTGLLKGFKWQAQRTGTSVEILIQSIPGENTKQLCLTPPLKPDTCTYATATISLVGVTGIIDTNQGTRVEYQISIQPTALAQRIATAFGSSPGENAILNRVALFLKYDDGWRVAE